MPRYQPCRSCQDTVRLKQRDLLFPFCDDFWRFSTQTFRLSHHGSSLGSAQTGCDADPESPARSSSSVSRFTFTMCFQSERQGHLWNQVSIKCRWWRSAISAATIGVGTKHLHVGQQTQTKSAMRSTSSTRPLFRSKPTWLWTLLFAHGCVLQSRGEHPCVFAFFEPLGLELGTEEKNYDLWVLGLFSCRLADC